jgi:hypothetical protein
MLFTSGVFEPLPSDHAICGGLHRNEFGDRDYNKFRVLRIARPPGRLAIRPHSGDYPGGQAIRGRPAHHQRLRAVPA